MEQAVIDMSAVLGERASCTHLRVPRGNFQRRQASRHVDGDLERQTADFAIALEAPSAGGASDMDVSVEGVATRQVRRYQARQEAKSACHASSRSLSAEQRQAVLDAVHQIRFVDRSVPYIYGRKPVLRIDVDDLPYSSQRWRGW